MFPSGLMDAWDVTGDAANASAGGDTSASAGSRAAQKSSTVVAVREPERRNLK